jgi:putative tryptophan/tyrosine transport system substrate-binding protein
MGGKWIEVLKEIDPRVARVAVIFNPDTAPQAGFILRSIEVAAPSFAAEPIAAPLHDAAGIESTLAALGQRAGGGVIVMPDAFTTTHRDLIVALAARHHVPAIYPFRYMIAAGGLISYGNDALHATQQVALYVDRILKGIKPGDLPVQQPTKFELAILKTAKALGLEVPPTLLARADEVIE